MREKFNIILDYEYVGKIISEEKEEKKTVAQKISVPHKKPYTQIAKDEKIASEDNEAIFYVPKRR